MKQYLLFVGMRYYPSPSMQDFVGDFDTVESALAAAKAKREYLWSDADNWYWVWYQIYDIKEKKIVSECYE